jgi:hypothetical protein
MVFHWSGHGVKIAGMEISIGDLYQAFYAQLENSDRIFAFWLSATFAVVVATFFAAANIT